jgi:hypothetical protein
LFFGKI